MCASFMYLPMYIEWYPASCMCTASACGSMLAAHAGLVQLPG